MSPLVMLFFSRYAPICLCLDELLQRLMLCLFGPAVELFLAEILFLGGGQLGLKCAKMQ